MDSGAVEIKSVHLDAARKIYQNMRDKKFARARERSLIEKEVVLEALSLAKYLQEADTRTNCILAISFLEDTLKKNFIDKWSIKGRKSYDIYFGSNGPISTLSQRTLVAQALGWFSDEIVKELDLLRKIRNEFAHNHRVHKLSEEPLQSFAAQLRDRERLLDTDDTPSYQLAYQDSSADTKLRMRVYCCVLNAIAQVLARSKLINHDVPPAYREKGFAGLTGIEQDLINTSIKYCLDSFGIGYEGDLINPES